MCDETATADTHPHQRLDSLLQLLHAQLTIHPHGVLNRLRSRTKAKTGQRFFLVLLRMTQQSQGRASDEHDVRDSAEDKPTSISVPVTMSTVLVLPPMLSFSRCVRRESRYGMWERFVSVNAWMQLPSADSDWLMLFASCQCKRWTRLRWSSGRQWNKPTTSTTTATAGTAQWSHTTSDVDSV